VKPHEKIPSITIAKQSRAFGLNVLNRLAPKSEPKTIKDKLEHVIIIIYLNLPNVSPANTILPKSPY
jgi:hypothetical protein